MKSALLVGINTYADPTKCPTLVGCINDITDMAAFLTTAGISNPVTISDADATAANVKNALSSAVAALGSGDELVFHFSGHGCQFPSNGVVHDAMCPADFDWSRDHAILDEDLAQIFATLNDGARLTIFADSCYSGGLTQNFQFVRGAPHPPPHRVRTIPVPPEIAAEIERAQASKRSMTFRAVVRSVNAVLVSGCTAQQESADATFDGRPNGAMSYYLIRQLSGAGGLQKSASDIVAALDTDIHAAQYDQTPELHGRTTLFGSALIATS